MDLAITDRQMPRKGKEPLKYEQRRYPNGSSYWVLTDEWKEWDRGKKITEAMKNKPMPKIKKQAITAENHVFMWKAVASFSDSNRRIFFCACMSAQGDPFRGCGAVGVQNSRTGEIRVTKPPRFE